MIGITFIPKADTDKMLWLNNFSAKINQYATLLGLSNAEVTSLQNDAAMFNYIIQMQELIKQTSQNVTAYKELLKHFSEQQHITSVPILPNLGPAPTPVPEGIFDRVSKLAKRIKANPNYAEPIGADLGIISVSKKMDSMNMQPSLKINLSAGHPHIKCNKGMADGMDLYVDRKDGKGFTLLGRLLKLDYIDNYPLPDNNHITEWSYKAIYVKANDNVGQMSPVVSVLVKKM